MRRLSAAGIEVKVKVSVSGPQRAELHTEGENGSHTEAQAKKY